MSSFTATKVWFKRLPSSLTDPLLTQLGMKTRRKWNTDYLTAMPRDEPALKQEYVRKGLHECRDTFIIHRILGNDLVHRHKMGQTEQSLRFILEHEPDFDNCSKRWVVNRIFDPQVEENIINILEQHDQKYLHIPFVLEDYARIGFDHAAFPDERFFEGQPFRSLDIRKQTRAKLALYRLKNIYVMNNNGARNAALEDGRKSAKWTMPFDGNCFVTKQAWNATLQAVMERPHLKYFIIPMQRLLDNQQAFDKKLKINPVEEPQLLFRQDSKESFNPDFAYGYRPKIEMFWRLGIPGVWNNFNLDRWDQMPRGLSDEAHQFGAAGHVLRLFSGQKSMEKASAKGFKSRAEARNLAIMSTIDMLDRKISG